MTIRCQSTRTRTPIPAVRSGHDCRRQAHRLAERRPRLQVPGDAHHKVLRIRLQEALEYQDERIARFHQAELPFIKRVAQFVCCVRESHRVNDRSA